MLAKCLDRITLSKWLLIGISMDDYEIIKNLELELVNPITRRNTDRLNELLSDDFEEVGSSGRIYSKRDILDILPVSSDVNYELNDFRFINLSGDCILVKYKANTLGVGSYRTSVWVRAVNSWQMLHHQSTVRQSAN